LIEDDYSDPDFVNAPVNDGLEGTNYYGRTGDGTPSGQTWIDMDPTAAYDFSLNSTSPLIDSGVFLTQTSGSGSDSSTNWMTLGNAGYFTDGFDGYADGDEIQIGSQTVTITDIDYVNDRIKTSPGINWSNGQNVSFPYSGSTPDIGANESNYAERRATTIISELINEKIIIVFLFACISFVAIRRFR
jgi:hypothetical protein